MHNAKKKKLKKLTANLGVNSPRRARCEAPGGRWRRVPRIAWSHPVWSSQQKIMDESTKYRLSHRSSQIVTVWTLAWVEYLPASAVEVAAYSSQRPNREQHQGSSALFISQCFELAENPGEKRQSMVDVPTISISFNDVACELNDASTALRRSVSAPSVTQQPMRRPATAESKRRSVKRSVVSSNAPSSRPQTASETVRGAAHRRSASEKPLGRVRVAVKVRPPFEDELGDEMVPAGPTWWLSGPSALEQHVALQRQAVQRAEEQAALLAAAESSQAAGTADGTCTPPPETHPEEWAQAYAEAEAVLEGNVSSKHVEPVATSTELAPPTKLQSDVNSLQFELDVQNLKNEAEKDRRANERMELRAELKALKSTLPEEQLIAESTIEEPPKRKGGRDRSQSLGDRLRSTSKRRDSVQSLGSIREETASGTPKTPRGTPKTPRTPKTSQEKAASAPPVASNEGVQASDVAAALSKRRDSVSSVATDASDVSNMSTMSVSERMKAMAGKKRSRKGSSGSIGPPLSTKMKPKPELGGKGRDRAQTSIAGRMKTMAAKVELVEQKSPASVMFAALGRMVTRRQGVLGQRCVSVWCERMRTNKLLKWAAQNQLQGKEIEGRAEEAERKLREGEARAEAAERQLKLVEAKVQARIAKTVEAAKAGRKLEEAEDVGDEDPNSWEVGLPSRSRSGSIILARAEAAEAKLTALGLSLEKSADDPTSPKTMATQAALKAIARQEELKTKKDEIAQLQTAKQELEDRLRQEQDMTKKAQARVAESREEITTTKQETAEEARRGQAYAEQLAEIRGQWMELQKAKQAAETEIESSKDSWSLMLEATRQEARELHENLQAERAERLEEKREAEVMMSKVRAEVAEAKMQALNAQRDAEAAANARLVDMQRERAKEKEIMQQFEQAKERERELARQREDELKRERDEARLREEALAQMSPAERRNLLVDRSEDNPGRIGREQPLSPSKRGKQAEEGASRASSSVSLPLKQKSFEDEPPPMEEADNPEYRMIWSPKDGKASPVRTTKATYKGLYSKYKEARDLLKSTHRVLVAFAIDANRRAVSTWRLKVNLSSSLVPARKAAILKAFVWPGRETQGLTVGTEKILQGAAVARWCNNCRVSRVEAGCRSPVEAKLAKQIALSLAEDRVHTTKERALEEDERVELERYRALEGARKKAQEKADHMEQEHAYGKEILNQHNRSLAATRHSEATHARSSASGGYYPGYPTSGIKAHQQLCEERLPDTALATRSMEVSQQRSVTSRSPSLSRADLQTEGRPTYGATLPPGPVPSPLEWVTLQMGGARGFPLHQKPHPNPYPNANWNLELDKSQEQAFQPRGSATMGPDRRFDLREQTAGPLSPRSEFEAAFSTPVRKATLNPERSLDGGMHLPSRFGVDGFLGPRLDVPGTIPPGHFPGPPGALDNAMVNHRMQKDTTETHRFEKVYNPQPGIPDSKSHILPPDGGVPREGPRVEFPRNAHNYTMGTAGGGMDFSGLNMPEFGGLETPVPPPGHDPARRLPHGGMDHRPNAMYPSPPPEPPGSASAAAARLDMEADAVAAKQLGMENIAKRLQHKVTQDMDDEMASLGLKTEKSKVARLFGDNHGIMEDLEPEKMRSLCKVLEAHQKKRASDEKAEGLQPKQLHAQACAYASPASLIEKFGPKDGLAMVRDVATQRPGWQEADRGRASIGMKGGDQDHLQSPALKNFHNFRRNKKGPIVGPVDKGVTDTILECQLPSSGKGQGRVMSTAPQEKQWPPPGKLPDSRFTELEHDQPRATGPRSASTVAMEDRLRSLNSDLGRDPARDPTVMGRVPVGMVAAAQRIGLISRSPTAASYSPLTATGRPR